VNRLKAYFDSQEVVDLEPADTPEPEPTGRARHSLWIDFAFVVTLGLLAYFVGRYVH